MFRWLWLIRAGTIIGVAICVLAPYTWAQETRPSGTSDRTPSTQEEPPLQGAGPSVTSYPLELLGLLAPREMRGPLTLMPSISAYEEYNDNVFADNNNRQWDFITGFTPAIMLFVNNPRFQLSAGYSFTAELYARQTELSNALARHTFLLNGGYQATTQLTLTLSDVLVWDRSANAIAAQGFTTGRQSALYNTLSPGLNWRMTPQTFLTLGATYGVERFEGQGGGADSDTYGFASGLGYDFTSRFAGLLGYRFTYLNVQGQDNSTTHTPTVGFNFRLTPTLTVSVSGGPSFTEIGGRTFVSPAVSAGLVQQFRIGTASVQYSRSVSVAGGFGGTTDSQTVSGSLVLPTWKRGLILYFSPVYSTAESVNSQQGQRVNVNSVTVNVGATYQIARFVSVFGGYQFLRQRTGGSSTQQVDVDQNRVRLGLQFGYPFNFD